ncbi:hypothetical protein COU37_01645 [Candidatus Micrarchaeota archaeon CG10_big_fil_rev_8_21_14_0_10_45_29]|nr:MAG: hypothetical protein COU37_01645 [Candidatus Micrarchaeota archaeon CG10_big_fil_rev_8_21_14_0_10_45_29]
MRNIRDPVHGQITLSSLEARLVDTENFQRLRGVRQLAMSYLVYPGAMHTRFEHSLGTMHLAGEMAQKLALDEDEKNMVRLSALLHDVGHTPFSHDGEQIFEKKFGTHEQIGKKLILASPLADIINENYDAKKVASLAFGEGFGQIITSDIGADRMDYLLRDAHYTGVAYGLIDYSRIIATLCWQNTLSLQYRGLEAAESLMIGRFMMFHTVYFHHAVRIARLMLQKSLMQYMQSKELIEEELPAYSDMQLLLKMQEYPDTKQWVDSLLSRRLFKRALEINWDLLTAGAKDMAESEKFSSILQEKYGSVLIDMPPKFSSEAKIKVIGDDGAKTLGERSPLASSLEATANKRATLLVCAPAQIAQEVGIEARALLEEGK